MPDIQRRARSRLGALAQLALAVAAGAALGLGQAPWALTWVGFAGLLAIVALFSQARGPRAALACGWGAGVGYFALVLNWVTEPFQVDAATTGWMAPFALALLAAGLALFWALAFWGAGRAAPGRRLFALVVIWSAVEMARAYLFTGFAWAQVGHVLIDTPLLHWASYGGGLGLCALIMGAAVALWHLGAGRRMAGAAGLAGLALLYAGGVALTPTDAAAPGPDAQTVRLVQPNAAQHEKWLPENLQKFYDRQRQFTAAPGENGRPDLVVWPETAIPTFLHQSDDLLAGIAASAQGAPDLPAFNMR